MDKDEEVVDLFDEDADNADDASADATNEGEPEKPAFEIPEKFRDKSLEDVVQSYLQLEEQFGRQGNELGELRKYADEFVKRDLQARAEPPRKEAPADEQDAVEFDDLLADPDKAVDVVLSRNPRLRKLEETVTRQQAQDAMATIKAAHPDVAEVVTDAKFLSWLSASGPRRQIFQTANAEYDADTVNEMLSLYKATHSKEADEDATQERNDRARRDLNAATTEKGGGERSKKKPLFYREDLVRMRIEQPERYEKRLSEIKAAYAEGRVISKHKRSA